MAMSEEASGGLKLLRMGVGATRGTSTSSLASMLAVGEAVVSRVVEGVEMLLVDASDSEDVCGKEARFLQKRRGIRALRGRSRLLPYLCTGCAEQCVKEG